MFKVLLINPSREHLARLDISRDFSLDLGDISSFPPMGLMYLAQALRQRSAIFEIKILDAVVNGLSCEEVVSKVLEYDAQVIGITAYSYTFYDVWKTANAIKHSAPSIPIVIGGPHMFIFARETMSHSCFDYGVAGDGEVIFSDFCEALYRGEDFVPASGLFYRKGKAVCGDGIAIVEDLNSFSFPALDLIDAFRYYNTIGKGSAVGTICSSRGCPFRCTFCQVPKRPYLIRSTENVIAEIREYVNKGISDFFFFDDLFNITKGRVFEICEEILRLGLKIGWMFRGRIDQMDNQMLKLSRRAGCHTISIGVEDATDHGLKSIKKNITIRQSFESVRMIRRNGIRCSVNWLIGLPSHRSSKDLSNLLDTAIRIKSDYAQFSILQCLPGSELYEQAIQEGGIDPEEWRGYVLNPVMHFSPPIWEKYLTKKELFLFYAHAYRRYYFRPHFILREVLYIRSASEAIHKIKAFKNTFFSLKSGSK